MKFICYLLLGCAVSCFGADQAKEMAVRDGSDYTHAVIIAAASSEEGVSLEKKWLDEHVPGYRMCDGSTQKLPNGDELICLSNATDMKDGRVFSIVCVRPQDGSHRCIYFDITSYFGKTNPPNQASEPTPTAVTSAAGQPPRQP